MPWTIFLESLTTWRSETDSPGSFAAYLARQHDMTPREAEETIEDWAALARRAPPTVTPST